MSSARITPEEFAKKHNIQQLLMDAANASYLAQAEQPGVFFAKYFTEKNAVSIIEDIRGTEVLDGAGEASVQVCVKLGNGVEANVQLSHSNSICFVHPSTARQNVIKVDIHQQEGGEEVKTRFNGHGCVHAEKCINENVAKALVGKIATKQETLDEAITSIADGSANFANISAHVAAAVSIGICLAAAKSLKQPPFLHVATQFFSSSGLPRNLTLPQPIITLVGTEPKWMGKVRVREVCILPQFSATAQQYPCMLNVLQCASRIVHECKSKLESEGTPIVINEDGSLKYNNYDNIVAVVDFAEECIKEAGFTPGQDVKVGLVLDSALCYKPDVNKYALVEGTDMTGAQLAEFLYTNFKDRKSVVYFEDTHHEKDVTELKRLMYRLGGQTVITGNNICGGNLTQVTNLATEKAINNCAIRLNDCGTVSNALQLGRAFTQKYEGATLTVAGEVVEGHGGFLADFAVGVHARFLRCGGILRPDHCAIYNRLIEIEHQLEDRGLLGSPHAFPTAGLELPSAPLEPVVEVNVKDTKKKK